jgi:hypothetical protein
MTYSRPQLLITIQKCYRALKEIPEEFLPALKEHNMLHFANLCTAKSECSGMAAESDKILETFSEEEHKEYSKHCKNMMMKILSVENYGNNNLIEALLEFSESQFVEFTRDTLEFYWSFSSFDLQLTF